MRGSMWLQKRISKDMHFENIGLHAQNMISIMGSMPTQLGRHIWLINEHENLHFDNGQDGCMSSTNYEE